jgi:hypothetical protein
MNFSFKIVNIELIRSSTNVSFIIPVSLHYPVDLGDHHIVADIKFSFFVKERTVDVELNNEGFLGSIIMFTLRFHDVIQLIYFIDDSDTISSIS